MPSSPAYVLTHPEFVQHRQFDRPQYIVTRDYGQLGFESVSHPEADRKSIINDIVSGEIDRVVSVVEVWAVEGHASDITSDIRDAVEEQLAPHRVAAE